MTRLQFAAEAAKVKKQKDQHWGHYITAKRTGHEAEANKQLLFYHGCIRIMRRHKEILTEWERQEIIDAPLLTSCEP
jgi:hypothetical protein